METTDAKLQTDLIDILDRVVDDQEIVIVRRKDSRDVAMLPASEL